MNLIEHMKYERANKIRGIYSFVKPLVNDEEDRINGFYERDRLKIKQEDELEI